MRVAVFDPSLHDYEGNHSPNVGDSIIARAVDRVVDELFAAPTVIRIPTHVRPTKSALRDVGDADVVLVGGSNLLGNRVLHWRQLKSWQQWPLSQREARVIDRAILLGVGWRTYEEGVSAYTARLLRSLMAPDAIHSTRDAYTTKKLREVGGVRALNTACPTLWQFAKLPPDHVSATRAETVLTMLTDYRPDPVNDLALLKLLDELYDRVILWPQGSGDLTYLRSLGHDLEVLGPSLDDLGEFVSSNSFDYVGNRLHGGIYCLESGKRSLIIAVDNRATEMLPGLGVPVVQRGRLRSIRDWVENPKGTRVKLDEGPIALWKSQFA